MNRLSLDESIAKLADYLGCSNRIYIFTGAGISTDSGIPDFRGPKGVWKQRQPVYYQDFMKDETARIEYWDYKLDWWENNREARPNSVHKAIYKLEEHNKVLMVVTQNIDGLHRLAGTSQERIVEVHGTNWEVECQTCLERTGPAEHFDTFKQTGKAPLCHCGGYLKPATISFGQNLRENEIERAQLAAMEADCVIAMGSTLSVYPAASFPLLAARRGLPYIIINQGVTDHDRLPEVSLRIDAPLGDVFPASVERAVF